MAEFSLSNGATGVIESLTVGDSQQGRLLIASGSKLSSFRSYVGIGAASNGVATVTGNDSQWNHSDLLSVGYGGQGTLNVEAGGVVSNTVGYLANFSGSIGTATVTGADSQWNLSNVLYVGNGGAGTLNVEDGGVVNDLIGLLGRNAGASGTANVTGIGSEWNHSDNLYVGHEGSGILNVQSGGAVNNVTGVIGNKAGSNGTVTVTGVGSQWNNSSNLIVGESGSGMVSVNNGASLMAGDDIMIGNLAGSVGTVNVNGGQIQSSNLNVGVAGTGQLILQDGSVNVAGALAIGNMGLVRMAGGALAANSLDQGSGQFEFLGGELSVQTFEGELVQDGGTLVAGNSPGSMTVNGDFDFNAGELEVEIAGLVPGSEFDFYHVTGNVSLSGSLAVSILNHYLPSIGDEFLFMQVDGLLSGQFQGLAEGDLATYLGNGVGLYINYTAGDGNDISLSALSAVPEPTSALLFGITCSGLLFRRRKRTIGMVAGQAA